MKYELMTVVTVNGARKSPITVFINHNEIDIDHRVNLVIDCYKRVPKFDASLSKEQKAAVLHLLEVMRGAIHGAAQIIPPMSISENDVALEYRVYQSQFKEGE